MFACDKKGNIYKIVQDKEHSIITDEGLELFENEVACVDSDKEWLEMFSKMIKNKKQMCLL